jgi:hypothetical protein
MDKNSIKIGREVSRDAAELRLVVFARIDDKRVIATHLGQPHPKSRVQYTASETDIVISDVVFLFVRTF